MAFNAPDADTIVNPPNTILPNDGSKTGINTGPTSPANPPSLQIAADPNAPQKILQQAWRPPSLLDLHKDLGLPQIAAGIAAANDQAGQAVTQAGQALVIAQAGGGNGAGNGNGGGPAPDDPYARSPSRRSYVLAPGGGGAGFGVSLGGGRGAGNKAVWDDELAAQTSRNLDDAIQKAYQNLTVLNNYIASRQTGSTTVTGSSLQVPTGLVAVSFATGSIANGATAHNFWVSVNKSQTPGALDIYVFQPTAANNNTPIPCTTAVVINWVAEGSIS